jgi:hypothetical protein
MFEPKKPTSEFTQQALDGVQKQLAEVTGFSLSYVYGMLAGTHPDHLDYARDIHRGLCIHKPESSAGFRSLLESDAGLIAGKGRKGKTPDKAALTRLCHGLINTFVNGTEEDADSAMVKLHAALSSRLSVAGAEVVPIGRRDVESELRNSG